MMRVLIAGFSARAAAESAAHAGFDVIAADAFNDLDQHPAVQSISLKDARTLACDAVVYLANFENRPRAVERLADGRALWGNPPDVLRQVRDPIALADALQRRGLPAPMADRKGPPRMSGAGLNGPRWLVKPLRSGGGHGIRVFDGDVPRGHYLQERIDGLPGSIVFAAAAGRAIPLAVSRQLVGDAAFGASGFQYCGNILGAGVFDDAIRDAAAKLAAAVAEEFELVGLNGIDFVVRDEAPYAIEVNPRWCASMELVERVLGLSVFAAHAGACRDGVLPAFDARRALRAEVVGKAIVFARENVRPLRTGAWLEHAWVRDVPRSAVPIAKGHPICTVFASGSSTRECHEALAARATAIYRMV